MQLHDGILRSDLLLDLPVVHGFTTVSLGNQGFGKNPGDPDVIANRQRLFAELRLADRTLVQPKQTHSSRVVESESFVKGCEADATYGRSTDCLHSVLTADCVPLLVYHPEGVVAAIHAGWRGLMGNIIPATLAMLPKHPLVAIGPAIGPCCYEVGSDLAEQFEHRFGTDVVDRSGAKPRVDLVRAALVQLRQAGVEEIDAAHLCTSCHADLFFSYRRDGSSGRMLAYIGLAGK